MFPLIWFYFYAIPYETIGWFCMINYASTFGRPANPAWRSSSVGM